MKYLIVFSFLFVTFLSAQNEQEKSKDIYIYKTFEDYEDKNEEHLGTFIGYSQSFNYNLHFINKEGEKDKKSINKFWGFRIGEYYFRYKKGRWFSPMYIAGIKEKVFYYKGELIFSIIASKSDSGSVQNTRNLILYSDSLNSKFIDIDKLSKKEKNNTKLNELIPCVKKGLERHGYNPVFKSVSKCINTFLNK